MPDLPPDMTLARLTQWAIEAHPELEGARFSILADGWDSVALDVDDRWILKFPRHQLGVEGLRREAAVLDVVRGAVEMPVAAIALFEAPVLHSMHAKIPGVSLLPALYATLTHRRGRGIGAVLRPVACHRPGPCPGFGHRRLRPLARCRHHSPERLASPARPHQVMG
ncbi:hypothetical protein [Devosia sediminis]|uniref:hypothetical protein n=1 Tax=Devosia sediminis TaxID=2798801 RepID=UPI001F2A1F96|nr:hypothetical protein [Devosia sediminis]